MKTILIVEDEHSIAEMLAAILEEVDYQVVIAGNGQEALTRLETTSPDLILSDIMMPIMDGRTLCRKLQAHPIYRLIPIVLMSAAYDTVRWSSGSPGGIPQEAVRAAGVARHGERHNWRWRGNGGLRALQGSIQSY